MRRLTALLVFFVLLFICCKKDNATRMDVPELYGKWQWTRSYAGLGWHASAGRDTTVVLTLNADHTYTSQLNGKLVASGSFQINTDENNQVLQFNEPFTETGGLALTRHYYEVSGSDILDSSTVTSDRIAISNNNLELIDYPGTPEPWRTLFVRR